MTLCLQRLTNIDLFYLEIGIIKIKQGQWVQLYHTAFFSRYVGTTPAGVHWFVHSCKPGHEKKYQDDVKLFNSKYN